MRRLVPQHLDALAPYVPGKPIEETIREYGVLAPAKLASNENALGPSPRAVEAAARALAESHLYPDASAHALKAALCRHHARDALGADEIVVGNGTNELLVLLVRALVEPDQCVLVGWPSFVVYRLAAQGANRREVAVPLDDTLQYDFEALGRAAAAEKPKIVFLANPNNPTGRSFGDQALSSFLAQVPADTVVVLDEAYVEYVDRVDYPAGIEWARRRPRTLVTRTFSKVYGLAALRVGYAFGDREIISVLERLRDPFNVNRIGQIAAIAALEDTEHVERSRLLVATERPRLTEALSALGFDVAPSDANFVLATRGGRVPQISVLNEELLRRGVIVRPMGSYGLPNSLRVTVGTPAENQRLVDALTALCAKPDGDRA